MVADLTHDDFQALTGEQFTIELPQGTLSLRLALVRAHGSAPLVSRVPFSLFFHGPSNPLLPQAIYPLEHPQTGRLGLFIVPVGSNATGIEYEATFS